MLPLMLFVDCTLFSVFMGFVFSLGTAFVLNFIIHQHQILTKKSWLPALLFLVLSSSTKGFLWLNPQLIAGIFILLSLHFYWKHIEWTMPSHLFSMRVFYWLGDFILFSINCLCIIFYYFYYFASAFYV